MSSRPPSSTARPAAAPAALAAFLRGVERRGAVLAELQTGDAATGDVALGTAMRRFSGQVRGQADGYAMTDWPARFWATLLAEPGLRNRTALALPLDAADNLVALASGPRIALLLRLAAGLSEDEAAAVLGVPASSYRMALQRALPHHPDGRADPQAWQRLRDEVHRRIKTLPAPRLERLARAREAALAGVVGASAAAADAAQRAEPARAWPRGLLAGLWLLLGLCVLAFAATFWGPFADRHRAAPGDGSIRVQPLPEEAPASRYSPDAGLISHRDYALLADPDGVAASRELAFHSWLAAQEDPDNPLELGPMPDATDVAPAPIAGVDAGLGETQAEADDAR